MSSPITEVVRRLAREAEAVCRHYLPAGRRYGRYWSVGDLDNTPGRSLYVRLTGTDAGPGAAGKWTDSATLQHGDLLDLIACRSGCRTTREALDEARRFLSLPPSDRDARTHGPPASTGSPAAARRLFAAGRELPGTLAETYLRARGICGPFTWPALRFHPGAWYRADLYAPRESWPALLAAITDEAGHIIGLQRTWLARDGSGKAPLADPRRAMGMILGGGVRFGRSGDVLVAGEGIETILSLKSVAPRLPMVAGLSANHLAALNFPPGLCRLYVARDFDEAGRRAAERLHDRGREAGIATADLLPERGDFNADLCWFGPSAKRARLAAQLVPDDRRRFLSGSGAFPIENHSQFR